MPIVARFLSTADFIANHTPAEPSAPIGKITFRRERDRQLAIKKGPSAKLGPDGDSGGHGAPSVAIQADQADFISTYRSLRLRFKVKGRRSKVRKNPTGPNWVRSAKFSSHCYWPRPPLLPLTRAMVLTPSQTRVEKATFSCSTSLLIRVRVSFQARTSAA
jgi:hypothetical protein